MLTEVCLGENVFREGSSLFDCNGPIPKLLESDQICELYEVKNDGCSKSTSVLDLSGHVKESCGLEDLSVSQKYPDNTFIRHCGFSKNVDAQGISEADFHTSVIGLQFDKNLSGSGTLFDLPFTYNNDLSYNEIRQHCSGANLCERSSAVNHFTPFEKLLAPDQFSELLCSQSDYLSQHLDAHDCSAVDKNRGSSAMGVTSAAQAFSVSTKLSEPSSAGNYHFSDNMSGRHFSQSDSPFVTFGGVSSEEKSEINENDRADPIDSDSDPTTTFPYVINQSPRRWSFRKTKSRQNAETENFMRGGRYAGEVSLDWDLLQFTRRRRSCFSKRARASAWGSLSNPELDFLKYSDRRINLNENEKPNRSRDHASGKKKKNQHTHQYPTEHEKLSRSRGQASGKRKKNQLKKYSEKVTRKRSHRTSGISVKFKFGFGVGLGSIKDVCNEGPSGITGKIPDPPNEENLTNSMMTQGSKENLKRMVHLSDDTTCDVGKYFVGNTSNLGSDLGTSPDSEVINLNLDTSLWGNSEEELHNVPGSMGSDGVTCLVPKNSEEAQEQIYMGSCGTGDKPMKSRIVDDRQSAELGEIAVDVPYSINISASSSSAFLPGNTSSSERKSKEQPASPVVDMGSVCVPSADIGTEVTPTVGFDLQSPVLQVSVKVHPRSKGQRRKPEINVSENKGRCISRKKVNQHKLTTKHKLEVKLRGCLTSSETERQAGTGNSKLAGSKESGTAKSSLTGDESPFNVVPGGFTEQSKKPRDAWVLCDNCQKWRRIPAKLADHIEETNCSW